jgi:hypothetical protein
MDTSSFRSRHIYKKRYISLDNVNKLFHVLVSITLILIMSFIGLKAYQLTDTLQESAQTTGRASAWAIKNGNDLVKAHTKLANDADRALNEELIPTIQEARSQIIHIGGNSQKLIIDFNSDLHSSMIKLDNNLDSSNNLLIETTKQIKINGEEVTFMVMDSRDQLKQAMVELTEIIKGAKLITNDPNWQKLISNGNDSVMNLNHSLAHVEVITKNFADLSDYIIPPIVNPEPVYGVWGHIKSIAGKGAKVALGFGKLYYIFSK